MVYDTETANLALSHLGSGKEILNLETEKSEEARVCRRFYPTALKNTLRDFDWPFATRIQALGLIEENPTTDYAYSYQYPSSCIKFRKINSGIRNDSRASRVHFRIANGDSGSIILTDQASAEGEWTTFIDNPDLFPPDFKSALSLRLAAYAAPRLTGGDAHKLGARAMALYDLELVKAQANAGNEEQPEESPDSESILARL